jgi:hypothetical protein
VVTVLVAVDVMVVVRVEEIEDEPDVDAVVVADDVCDIVADVDAVLV